MYHKIISFEGLWLRLVGLQNATKMFFWSEMKGGVGSYEGDIKVTQNRPRTFEDDATLDGKLGRPIDENY